jgi:nicotinate-nucleotide pyrophosphorylase (carboxylating)
MDYTNKELKTDFSRLVRLAIEEDLGDAGDVTSSAVFSTEKAAVGLFSREDGVLSGIEYALECFSLINPDSDLYIRRELSDGDSLSDGLLVAQISGPVSAILRAERIALNFLGFFSGIAGTVKRHVDAVGGFSTRILDTRKTLPGFRRLSKAAVLDGGGHNHRMGLFDMVMIKDNHVDAAGGLEAAVTAVRKKWGNRFRIELECRSPDEVARALALDVDVIMLDNMSYEQCAESLELRRSAGKAGRCAFEASGDFTPEKISRYADLNLDYISVGGLTHSVRNHNFSMRFIDRFEDEAQLSAALRDGSL